MKKVRLIPPPLTALLLLTVAYIIDRIFTFPKITVLHSVLLTVICILSGGIIIFWSFILFRKNKTTLNPNSRPKKFILAGPYKISRNPMYLGLLLFLAGNVFLESKIVFLIPPIIFFILMNMSVIPHEEKSLKNLIGEDKYRFYLKKVRRWI